MTSRSEGATQAVKWQSDGDYYHKRQGDMFCVVEGMPGWWIFSIDVPQKRYRLSGDDPFTTAFAAKRACDRALKTIEERLKNVR